MSNRRGNTNRIKFYCKVLFEKKFTKDIMTPVTIQRILNIMKTRMISSNDDDCSEFGENAEFVHSKVDLCTRKYRRESETKSVLLIISVCFNVMILAASYFGDRNVELTYEVIAVSAILFMASVMFMTGVIFIGKFIKG